MAWRLAPPARAYSLLAPDTEGRPRGKEAKSEHAFSYLPFPHSSLRRWLVAEQLVLSDDLHDAGWHQRLPRTIAPAASPLLFSLIERMFPVRRWPARGRGTQFAPKPTVAAHRGETSICGAGGSSGASGTIVCSPSLTDARTFCSTPCLWEATI